MQASRQNVYLLLCLIATTLAGCNLHSHTSQIQGADIALPAAVVNLPAEGILSAKVYKDNDTVPLFINPDIDTNTGSVTLEFSAPAGTHIFTVMFEYIDPEFNQDDGTPWPLAYWISEPQQVTESESLLINIDNYNFVDSDADGISNAQELKDRTDPGDANDPGVPQEKTPPITPDNPPDTNDTGNTTDPGGTTDPGDTSDPFDPGLPAGTNVMLPDGIWRGEGKDQNPNLGNVIAIVSANRVFMMENDTIYDGTFTMDVPEEGTDTTNSFTGSVDVYSIFGDKLTATAPVVITGSRPDNNHLALQVDAVTNTTDEQTLILNFEKHYNDDSSQERIADIWQISIDQPFYFMVFPIDSNGTVTGASDTDGCLYSGNVLVEDTQFNLYNVEISLQDQVSSACGVFTGTDYTGYASRIPNNDTLFLLVANGAHALFIELTRLGKKTANDPHYPRPVSPQDTTVDGIQ